MAPSDYYKPPPRPSSQQPPPAIPQSLQQQQPSLPYYAPYNQQSAPSIAPSYHTNPPRPEDRTSPFEAPFDDHVYPMSRPGGQQFDSQSSLGADSRYYGQGGRLDQLPSFQDDIPLRDHPGMPSKDNNSTDHVYDAPAPSQLEQGRKNRFSAMGMLKQPGKRIPWLVYILTTIQVVVFIVEIVKNAQLTGSPIEIHPQFNPMIGPSPYVLINMGSRYVPCMHSIDGLQNRASGGPISWPCPNTTSDTANCQLNNLCGFGMPASEDPAYPPTITSTNIADYTAPNQWFRFITPIFLHAGIIHIGFNMLLQVTLGREIEMQIGTLRFFLVYFSSGIFGFVLGGNFAATGISSTGASGALFGILALNLLDLLYTWNDRPSPWKDFAFIMLDVVISFVLGLLPGLDNFSHIGGFFMGLVLGICILHSPNALRKRIVKGNEYEPPFEGVASNSYKGASDGHGDGAVGFVKSPVGFFKGRKGAWWAWWLVRVGSLVFVFIVFVLLLNNFYRYRKTCSWCKYLSCLNVNNWCNVGNLQFIEETTNTTSKRSVFDTWDMVAKIQLTG
ncbi:rhomboid-domain-containing protein [Hyaloscypha variabilis F]|uniref:Rhomboid-type serine protease n=1 Tax=Hyaloscypha variabilis (strain UAMH 11265 / GT02V1 / F) TaxID=1149755 RepID=A0A2J6RRJ8_HYAVF|nr:rhomboid-domain-containing protein [Hyaloscypha variabilis F]